MTDQELLWEAICRSGRSVASFAREPLLRSPSTVRRWLRGSPMPRETRAWLHKRRAWLEAPGRGPGKALQPA